MHETTQTKDLLAKPLSFFTAWGAPLIALIGLQFMASFIPLPVVVVVSTGALAWMGVACLANAARCGRRHCFYSGPIFLAAAIATLLIGVHALPIGPNHRDVVWTALALVALTFLFEQVWGKYVARDRRKRS